MCCLPTRFYTPNCSRSRKGLAPREIISREIWERFQLIDISTVWQPESNYLKRVKSGRKRVVKEMISGSLSLPFPLFLPANFSRALYFRVFPTIWEPGTGYTSCHPAGAPNDNFSKIFVRKTIWDLDFSEHLLLNFLLACLSEDFRTPQKWYNCPLLTDFYPKKVT